MATSNKVNFLTTQISFLMNFHGRQLFNAALPKGQFFQRKRAIDYSRYILTTVLQKISRPKGKMDLFLVGKKDTFLRVTQK